MNVSDFISRLDKVRQTGPGRWMASCPAHDDRNPSMTIAEGDDGRVLIHDFGGCSVEEIVGAVGLTLSDIMPEVNRGQQAYKPIRNRFPAMDVLKAMAFNATVVALAAADLGRGKSLSEDEKNKLLTIAGEFDEAISMVRTA